MKLRIESLGEANWADLETLFARPGLSVARGCWCMYYRRTGRNDRAGFVEIARRKPMRPLMRKTLSPRASKAKPLRS